ncbi:MAG: single-stranded-DNA-specific exonuclease RecJ [Bacteroidetes bacterium]|nr:single-stranded-DNA-specific exonuclease RecJ [Bacteroidota bacterium]
MRLNVKPAPSTEAIEALSRAIHIDRLNTILLLQRGVTDFDSAKNFFRPSLQNIHDPFLMRDMDKAVDRILKAQKNKEKILVYGDYDVDGTTSVALFYSYLCSIGATAGYYIPDRYAEGYGISLAGIDYAKENNYTLIVSLDCGIKANDKILYAHEKGIDFIICDHHLPGEEIPNAVAILDPKRKDCAYPFKELSGCGVGFKLAQALHSTLKKPFEQLVQLLDYVAISIAADIVSVSGENRIFCFYGLQELNKMNKAGIKALCLLNKKNNDFTINDVVFKLAPRINAAGRIDHAMRAVELLLSKDEEEAGRFAEKINQTNSNRKDIDKSTTEHALSIMANDSRLIHKKTTVVFHETWHKGVVGIVASRLIDTYYRPTIVLTEVDGVLSGSARSVKNFDVHTAIEKCAHLLTQFGGHKHAAGLSLKAENLPSFTQLFEEVVSKSISEKDLIPEIDLDAVVNFNEITPKFFAVLKQMAPHGPDNMTPIFVSHNVLDTGWAKIVGAKNSLKLTLYQAENPNVKMSAMAYGMGDYLHFFQRKIPMSVCYTIEENTYNGVTSLQLTIRYMQPMQEKT